jgi:hypothetical protein
MQDVNMFDDLRQQSFGQVKALEYGRYDIIRYCFQTEKLEASYPLVATTNSWVVANDEDASGLAADYYDMLQKIIEYTFGGSKELKIIFFECDWFDPVNGTRVDNFGMVEVKHELHYSGNNILFAHQAQQVYYLSYPHESIKHWWVVYKVNPEIDTRRYDVYVERHNDDDVAHVYQEENEWHQSLSFTESNGAGLAELATHYVKLMEEEPRPSKKCLRKSKRLAEKQERREQLNARVAEADLDDDDFW